MKTIPPRPEAPLLALVRLTLHDAEAWWDDAAARPRSDLGAFPYLDVLVYANLLVGTPEPMMTPDPDVREAIVAALAEALVRAYRRETKNLLDTPSRIGV
jgi:hypothetical protein